MRVSIYRFLYKHSARDIEPSITVFRLSSLPSSLVDLRRLAWNEFLAQPSDFIVRNGSLLAGFDSTIATSWLDHRSHNKISVLRNRYSRFAAAPSVFPAASDSGSIKISLSASDRRPAADRSDLV